MNIWNKVYNNHKLSQNFEHCYHRILTRSVIYVTHIRTPHTHKCYLLITQYFQ